MAWFKDAERTEPATPKRREEARKKGQVAKSREIPTAFLIMTGIASLYFSKGFLGRFFIGWLSESFLRVGSFSVTSSSVIWFGLSIMKRVFIAFLPFVLSLVLASYLSNVLQVGFIFTAKPVEPNLSRINPVEGFSRLISPESLFEVLKSLLKMIVMGYVGYKCIRSLIPKLGALSSTSNIEVFRFATLSTLKVCLKLGIFLTVLAVSDYAFQRYRYLENLKMTREEVKEEFKEREGDPLVKARIKSLQRQLARRRMMEKVKEADVVITNPTHIAVALKYDMARMEAPQVVAKGAGFIAERIKETARRFGIVIVEDKPLAQVLYRTVDVGEFIPPVLYKAVAKILAYVYQLKGRRIVT